MGQSGLREATVAIFGLRSVEDRSLSINPTNVSGDISVILDVQPNDETVTGIALMLGDETIQCRGSSADADPATGLASSGGQIEVDCFLDTNAVEGECMGMQLMPRYANGDYALGAFVTTDEGKTRSVVATQPITLKNSGFVMIAHEAGEMSVVSETTKGLTFYGGRPVEGNVNSFHACPVSYTGTMVGEMQLGTIHTNTARPPVATDPQPAFGSGGLSFRRANGAPHFPVDDEAPFTWSIGTASWTGNGAVENVPGETEYWIENLGLIKNAEGLDVTGEFRGDETAKAGPFQFDFRAPRINQDGTSQIVVSANYGDGQGRRNQNISDGMYFSDGSSSTPARLVVSNVVEMGVGGVNETIAVGDCSVTANTDGASRGTAFVPGDGMDDVRNISELPEDDSKGELSDDGGLDCYVAELQALVDAIGNSTWLGGSTARVQSGGEFGVDRTTPEVSRLNPDEEVVLGVDAVTFEAEDPELETGEDASGLGLVVGQRYRSGRYRSEVVLATRSGGDVTANISDLGEGSHAVRVLVGDGALPTNWAAAFFNFTRDTKAPTFTAGSGPGAVSAGSSDRVTVTVSGSIRDANVINEALLSVWSNGGSQAICGPDDSGDTNLTVGTSPRVRAKDVENDTKSIDFEESFTIRKAAGSSENLCFRLNVSDVAVDANGDDEGANTAGYTAGFFTIDWGLGMTLAAEVGAAGATLANGALMIAEEATGTYTIVLDAQPAGLTTVTVGGQDGNVTTNDSTFVFAGTQAALDAFTDGGGDPGAATATLWNAVQTVTVNAGEDARDDDDPEDAMDDMVTLTHRAAGGGFDGISGSSVPVTVQDNDVLLMVASHDISVGDAATTVTITATLANAVPSDGSARTVTVAFTDGTGAAATGITVASVDVTIDPGDTSGTADAEVDASGSSVSSGTIMVGGGSGAPDQVPATITIKEASS
ncbi:MAG: hypothetical protein F4X22_06465 [Gemmatimonadales bacterium]|nr:hypothetical protein [Candidatus Palauibacter denitrificans]